MGRFLKVRARVDSERRRALHASGVLTLAADESVVLAEGHGTFLSLSADTVDTILKDYPDLRDFFERYKPETPESG